MLANILFWGGIIVAIIGGISIIRFDGSITRVVCSGLAVLLGLSCLGIGNAKKNNTPVDYQIVEVQPLNNDNTKYRITLKAGTNSTIIYVDNEEVKNFKQGGIISLTKNQIEEY